ncbi:hypothetical protein V8F33_003978, partial [Rhypophila sp. PSN 637]
MVLGALFFLYLSFFAFSPFPFFDFWIGGNHGFFRSITEVAIPTVALSKMTATSHIWKGYSRATATKICRALPYNCPNLIV